MDRSEVSLISILQYDLWLIQFAPCSFSPEMQNLHRKLTDLLQEKADMQTRLREKYSK